ncbi:arsenic resistance protein [Georgenia sunbinii]|uniref:arsenic resistance protein n=1 Tax=Georgenia sunbinii TaxID=3117728 RepID=UPI002F26BE7D
MAAAVAWMERRQVVLYLVALAVGALVGMSVPAVAQPAEAVINPVIALLLYATFVGVPFGSIGRAFRDGRFLTTTLILNFILVPVVVLGLSRMVAHDEVLLVGVLLVLLAPCIDYVIVFTGLAGGAHERLLAAAPILMLGQLLLLPVYLWLFVGADVGTDVDLAPLVDAFVMLVVLPLAAAGLTRLAAPRTRWGRPVKDGVLGAMVPLMMLTLATVVASQISGVGQQITSLLLAIPVYVLFAAIMVPVGIVAARVARLDMPGARAVVFSGVTRNSLVILPVALALPAAFDLVPLVVVTQTLVELVVMVILVRLVPRAVRTRVTSAVTAEHRAL